MPVTRPRVRAADGSGELPIGSYELFTSTEILGKMAMEKMLAGLSTRRYPVGLEPVGERVTETSSATSKSAVSRKFVAMTETALGELLSRDLSGLDLVALMIDGVHFAESCCIVALGIGRTPPEAHRAATEVPRSSGHPRARDDERQQTHASDLPSFRGRRPGALGHVARACAGEEAADLCGCGQEPTHRCRRATAFIVSTSAGCRGIGG